MYIYLYLQSMLSEAADRAGCLVFIHPGQITLSATE